MVFSTFGPSRNINCNFDIVTKSTGAVCTNGSNCRASPEKGQKRLEGTTIHYTYMGGYLAANIYLFF